MNKLKKIASLVLALIMALALAAPAFAAETTGTITVTNTTKDVKYNAYRIFDLESYSTTNEGAYSYKVSEKWENFAKTEDFEAFATINKAGYVELAEGANAANFAKAAIKYAKDNSITPDADEQTGAADGGSVVFTGLPLGYYLVDSSDVESLCILDTTNPNFTVAEKKTEPTVDKQVQEMPSGEWGKKNDASIGDTVNFKTTVYRPATVVVDYVLHDALSEGLTYTKGSVKVYVNNEEVAAENYAVSETPEATTDKGGEAFGCDFDVTFDVEWLNTLGAGTNIEVTYSATLNEKAVIAGVGNPNDTYLEWGDKKTETSTTRTYTYEFDLVKMDGNTKKLLDGAQFKLYRKAKVADGQTGDLLRYDPQDPVTFNSEMAQGNDGWYIYTVDTQAEDILITVESGKVIIRGLGAGTYYLVEETAPDGYNKLAGEIEITLAATVNGTNEASTTIQVEQTGAHKTNATVDGTYPNAVYDDSAQNIGGVAIANNTGAELPSTGGIGTTIFYIVGGVMAAGAVILLITKRRMNMEK